MENIREREVLARRSPAPATAEARERKLVAAAGREKFSGLTYMLSGKWSAPISEPGSKKMLWLGTHPEADVAACAYDLAARTMPGDKAKNNFKYPPPNELVHAVATAPGRGGHVFDKPPPPARPGLGALPPGTTRITPGACRITLVRSIPPKPFSIQAAVTESRRVSDPVDLLAPPIHIVAPVRASSVETCFSSTEDEPHLKDTASSSRGMASNSPNP